MSFVSTPHLNLTASRIETSRLVLLPFSLDGRVDIRELAEEFCKANKDHFVSQFLPTYEQEFVFIQDEVEKIKNWEKFENFIFDKSTMRFIGCAGLNRPEPNTMNIGIWIRRDEHGKWYATEVYDALLYWARANTKYQYLKHCLNPANEPSRKLALKFGGIKQEYSDEKGFEYYHIPL